MSRIPSVISETPLAVGPLTYLDWNSKRRTFFNDILDLRVMCSGRVVTRGNLGSSSGVGTGVYNSLKCFDCDFSEVDGKSYRIKESHI